MATPIRPDPTRAPGIVRLPGRRPGVPYQLRASLTEEQAEAVASLYDRTGIKPSATIQRIVDGLVRSTAPNGEEGA